MASKGERERKRETKQTKKHQPGALLWDPSIVRLHCSTHCPGPSIAEGLIQYWSVHIGDIMML